MDANMRQAADAIAEALDDGIDVAEFVAYALCHVAADQGGIYEVLRNRSGSWEAGLVQQLMAGTVGEDGAGLDALREDARPEGVCEAELRLSRGAWRLDVLAPALLLQGSPLSFDFAGQTTVPTVAERTAALTQLGYRTADPERGGLAWTWLEVQEDDAQTPSLIAHTPVRPLQGEEKGRG